MAFFPPVRALLKVLDLKVPLHSLGLPLVGLCEKLQTVVGHNILEALHLSKLESVAINYILCLYYYFTFSPFCFQNTNNEVNLNRSVEIL